MYVSPPITKTTEAYLREELLAEMALPSSATFEPGYELYVNKNDEGRYEGNYYVIGRRKGEKAKGTRFYQKLSSKLEDSTEKMKKNGMDFEAVRKKLKDKGFVRADGDGLKKEKGTYAGNVERESGTVEPWKGTVYHGTADIDFFGTIYNKGDLGGGSHLTSLNGGDAFSVTPDFDTAASFAQDNNERIGMVIEFKADLMLYYVPPAEDDMDDIEMPKEANAAAIPFGQYQEHEFAVTLWDQNLDEVAVFFQVDGKWKRYKLKTDAAMFGMFRAYLADWLGDIFKGDVEKMVSDADGYDVEREEEGGVIVLGDFAFMPLETKPFFVWKKNVPEDDRDDEYWYLADEDTKKYFTVEEFEDERWEEKYADQKESRLPRKGSIKLYELWSNEAQQDFAALMGVMPKSRKEKHKKRSLFDEGSLLDEARAESKVIGYIGRDGKFEHSTEIKADRVDAGEVRVRESDEIFNVDVARPLSPSQRKKLQLLVRKVNKPVDLDARTTNYRDFDHFKRDRLDAVVPAIDSFFEMQRIPRMQPLAKLDQSGKRMDQAGPGGTG